MVDDRTALMSAKALTPGYEVLWYTIDRVLGQGGFGITYLAHDRNLDRAVAIKEYLPTSFAFRQEDYSVKPITGDHRENFVWGLGSFLKEAQTLARFSHPNIVRVHSVFEENNTAYMVMEYEHGQNLAKLYKQRKNQNQAFFEQVFFPIIDGLKEIHKFEFIHRDIKPANIYIREDGTPVLIDFGSARQTTQQQTSEMTTLVSQGYTPLEQYSANYGDQGPWTDIYAMAATLYEGIVGRKPDESLSRSACLMRAKPDLLQRLDAQEYPGFTQQFLDAVHAGLKLEPEGRPQTLEAWAQIFAQGGRDYVSSPDSRGFTELEDDRTRIQPRRAVPEPTPAFGSLPAQTSEPLIDDFDSFTDLDPIPSRSHRNDSFRPPEQSAAPMDDFFESASSRPQSPTQSRAQMGTRTEASLPPPMPEATPASVSQRIPARSDTTFAPDDDLLTFDDDDLHTQAPRQTPTLAAASSQPARKGSGMWVAILGLLLALGAGGGYYFYSNTQSPDGLTAAALQALPKPQTAATTQLPSESVLEQLENMTELAPMLNEAWQLNPEDPVLLDTIRATEASLLAMARQWNASQYTDIASRIRSVSQALPGAAHDQNRVEGILSASAQVSAYAQVMALLEDKRYLIPAGDSVLDRITAVSASDYQKLKSSDQWQQMMASFSSSALEKLSQSRYEEAARLTEAALTLDADDAGFVALRSFLTGS